MEKETLTSVWIMHHRNAGQNMQHVLQISPTTSRGGGGGREKVMIAWFSGVSWSNGYGIGLRRQGSGVEVPPANSFSWQILKKKWKKQRKYMSLFLYVQLQYEVFPVSPPFLIYQGNTLSLPDVVTSQDNFVTACKRL